MNDESLEHHLRSLPAPVLPEVWRAEILSAAGRKARASSPSRQVWPTLLLYVRNFFLRNPVTASALTAVWLAIFFFKANTPVDPDEKMRLAHFDPRRPVYFFTLNDEILLAELEEDQPEQKSLGQMP